jgi:hypothetical protein
MSQEHEIEIEQHYDGWSIRFWNGNSYTWDHNEADLGTDAIRRMLLELGYKVVIIEDS